MSIDMIQFWKIGKPLKDTIFLAIRYSIIFCLISLLLGYYLAFKVHIKVESLHSLIEKVVTAKLITT